MKTILHREKHKSGHDSKEDALAALDLMKFKVTYSPEQNSTEQEAILYIDHHPQCCKVKWDW